MEGETYEFRVRGELSDDWTEWFDGFEILPANGESLLRGFVRDEAALYGFIAKFRNLGLALLSVNACRSGQKPKDSRFRE
jgi:hypothetical protein